MSYEIRELPAIRVASVRYEGPVGQAMGDAMEKISNWAKEKGLLGHNTLKLGVFWCRNENPDECCLDACVTVDEHCQPDPDNGIEIQTLPGGKYAIKLSNIYSANRNFTELRNDFISEIADLPKDDRPMIDIFYTSAASHPLRKFVADFCIAVQ